MKTIFLMFWLIVLFGFGMMAGYGIKALNPTTINKIEYKEYPIEVAIEPGVSITIEKIEVEERTD